MSQQHPPPRTAPAGADRHAAKDAIGLPLSAFAAEDRALLRELYGAALPLADLWRGMREAPDYSALRRQVEAVDGDRLREAAHSLGGASRRAGLDTPPLRTAVHEARGGLVVLANARDLLALLPEPEKVLRMAAHAARDYGRAMRDAVTDLDEPGRWVD